MQHLFKKVQQVGIFESFFSKFTTGNEYDSFKGPLKFVIDQKLND